MKNSKIVILSFIVIGLVVSSAYTPSLAQWTTQKKAPTIQPPTIKPPIKPPASKPPTKTPVITPPVTTTTPPKNPCINGKWDNGETGIDCGGQCKPCCAKDQIVSVDKLGNVTCTPPPPPAPAPAPPPPDPNAKLCGYCSPGQPTPPDVKCWYVSGRGDASTCKNDVMTYVVCGKDGKITASIGPCEAGMHCEGGACTSTGGGGTLQPTCTDSDGSDSNTRGTVTTTDAAGTSQQHVDSCSSDGTVEETICDGNRMKVVYTSCGPGQTCQNGAC